MIKSKYGLDVFDMESLLEECIEFAKAHPEPIIREAPSPKLETENKGIDSTLSIPVNELQDVISEDEEDELVEEEEFRKIGVQIQELLLDGQEISDELYVRMFVIKLRMKYEYKSPQQKRDEIKEAARATVKIQKRLGEIEVELQTPDIKKKIQKALEAEKELLQSELDSINSSETKGWVLVDFPCSYAQAKLLEEALSGYKPIQELDPTQRENELEEAALLVQPAAKPAPPKMLIRSGLDAVIWFKCPADECQKRADGRRVDPATNDSSFYHVFDVMPPSDQAPLCERLRPMCEDTNHCSNLVDRFVSYDFQEKAMSQQLQMFGIDSQQMNLMQEIDAGKSKERVFGQIMRIIEEVHGHNTSEKATLREVIAFKLRQTMDMMARAAESQGMTEEQKDSIVGNTINENQATVNATSVDSPKSKAMDSTRKPSRNDATGT